ncbi:MAG TPA: hypothetical protein VFQ91_00370 [Bryobacteraceae bacterium]|nr:hypothetical protein [Bryobacteraceae bacterium]
MVPRTLFANFLVALLFGVVVPYIKGIEYLDLFLLIPYSLLSLFFVAPMVVDGVFAAPRRGVPLRAMYRSVVVGWLQGVAVLWLGIATVSARNGHFIAPPVAVGLSLAVMSFFACLFVGALTVWTANRVPNAAAAKGRLRISFLLLMVLFFALPRLLHEDTVAYLLQYLTPEGIVRATLVLAPLEAMAAVGFLLSADASPPNREIH